MADLSRCNNIDCIKKDLCYRFKTDSEQYQGYKVEFTSICNEETEYTYFSPLEKPIEYSQNI